MSTDYFEGNKTISFFYYHIDNLIDYTCPQITNIFII